MAVRAGSRSLGARLQSMPKPLLYLVLFVVATVPLFFNVAIPNQPVESSIDLYTNLMALKAGDRVLVGSDWTNSTRGESASEMESLLKILIRKGVKFVVYSTADPQSPQVARDLIARVAVEEAAAGAPLYRPFTDYVVTGFYANSEGTNLGIENNVMDVFAGRKEVAPNGVATDVRDSPVLAGIRSVADFKYLVLVTASQTSTIVIERIKKVPLMFMVTGVMVPETQVYYQSGQIKGMAGGVKGVYDLETLMETGVNNGPGSVTVPGGASVPGFPGMPNRGKGTAYYPTLHACLFLLIFAIAVGNVGMFLSRRGAKGGGR